jgi:hypothetical protein
VCGEGLGSLTAKRVRIRLANGDIRHAALPQNETHTQWAAREFGAESRWAQTAEGTLVAMALIVEVSLVELDEQPRARGRVAGANGERGSAGARIFE